MIKLIKYTFVFLIPLFVLNGFIRYKGYLNNENQAVVLDKLLKTKSPPPTDYTVLCFGTSRFNIGIVPSYLSYGLKHLPLGKSPNCLNLSFSGQQPGYLLQQRTKYMPTHVDLTLIEIFPTIDPNANCLHYPETPAEYLDKFLIYYSTKIISLNMMNGLITDILRHNLAIKYSFYHSDGWEERVYNNNPNNSGIKRLKKEWQKDASEILKVSHKSNIASKYREYIKTISEYQKTTNSTICFIRMPVDGVLEEIQDSILAETKMVETLLNSFPNALYIDANKNQGLNNFHTAEDSHLTSIEAKRFSYYLGAYLGDLLKKKWKYN